MERVVNFHEAKTHLSRLVDDAAAGETIVLAKAGIAQAHLMPLNKPIRRVGYLLGQAVVPDDSKKPFEAEFNSMFYGDGIPDLAQNKRKTLGSK
jgi:antitoxin (DNA-binding transcriptional repressor) of toxin-antitoxin stability system